MDCISCFCAQSARHVNRRSAVKRIFVILIVGSYAMIGCGRMPSAAADTAALVIASIATSTKSFSIDCAPTSVTISARVTDASGVREARLLYRVGSDRPYIPVEMVGSNGHDFTATVKGPSLPPDRYGPLEFYITVQDNAGQQSRSTTDASVQFLPCVSH